jgi:hypothetical protein
MTDRAKYWDDLRTKARTRAEAVGAGRAGFNSEQGLKDFGKLVSAEPTEQLIDTLPILSKSADVWDQKRAGIIADELKKRGEMPIGNLLNPSPDQIPGAGLVIDSGGTPNLASTSLDAGGAVKKSETAPPPNTQPLSPQDSTQTVMPSVISRSIPPSQKIGPESSVAGIPAKPPVLGDTVITSNGDNRIIRQLVNLMQTKRTRDFDLLLSVLVFDFQLRRLGGRASALGFVRKIFFERGLKHKPIAPCLECLYLAIINQMVDRSWQHPKYLRGFVCGNVFAKIHFVIVSYRLNFGATIFAFGFVHRLNPEKQKSPHCTRGFRVCKRRFFADGSTSSHR